MLDLRKSFGDLRSFHNSGLSHPKSAFRETDSSFLSLVRVYQLFCIFSDKSFS